LIVDQSLFAIGNGIGGLKPGPGRLITFDVFMVSPWINWKFCIILFKFV
jgi:hypothetical protein